MEDDTLLRKKQHQLIATKESDLLQMKVYTEDCKTKRIETEESEIHERKDKSRQYIVGLSASFAGAVLAANSAWNSPAMPHLKSNQSSFPVTQSQGGFIISIYHFGDIFGCLFSVLYLDRVGRKISLYSSALPMIFAWILIIFATNHFYLLIARLIAGFGQGIIYNTVIIYLTEIAEKNIRGLLVNIFRMEYTLFYFAYTAIGTFCSYEILNLASLSVPIIFLIIILYIPESPYYLLLQGKDEDALECLMKLRGCTSNNRTKLNLDIREMKLDMQVKRTVNKDAVKELIIERHNCKCMLIVLCVKLTQVMSGHSAILNNTQEIFAESGSSVSPEISTLILSGIGVIFTPVGALFLDRVSKRLIFSVSGVLVGIFLAIFGTFFFLKNCIQTDQSLVAWLPLTVLIFYQIVYYPSIPVIPYIVQGELFSMNVKTIAVAVGMMIGSTFSFVSNTSFNLIRQSVGIHVAFWFYALVSTLSSVLTYWIIPKSEGKTLEEIHAMQNLELKRKLEEERRKRGDFGKGIV